MILSKSTKKNILLFLAAFLLCGFLHVFLYGTDFTFCISPIFGSAVVVLWTLTVRERIIDRRLRRIIQWIAVTLLLHFLLEVLRYDLFAGNITAQRWLWYTMYLPMTAQPVLCYFLSVFIHRPENKTLSKPYVLIILLGVLLVLGMLTNDLHFQAKSFPSGILDDNGQEKNEWLFYLINVFIYGLYALTLATFLKKNHRYVARKYRWIAVLPILIGAVYFMLYPLEIAKKVFGCHIWNMGEMTAFLVISTIEVCIQTGMIPANRGYEALFSSVSVPAVITDVDNAPVYQTSGADYPFTENENVRIVSHPIHGGSIVYPVDVGQIENLNKDISQRVEQLETRNAYLAEETRVMQERAELETRNQLYENISRIVTAQLEQIEELLREPEKVTEEQLARISVLKAYIKRRSNMELLGVGGTLTVEELTTAIAETLEYVRLCGVNTASGSFGTGIYPAQMVTGLYDCIEAIIEKSLDTLSGMIVSVRTRKNTLTARVMLTADDFTYESQDIKQGCAQYRADVSISKEGADMIIALTFTEGGGQI